MTLFEKIESTDDYPRWKVIYDAWVDDPTTAINLRDMAGEYFDDFMVPVEATDRICTMHNIFAPLNDEICRIGSPHYGICNMVDVVRLGEPA